MEGHLENMGFGLIEIPVSFRVIAVGSGAEDVVEKVKGFGYEGMECRVADTADDCNPVDDDRMVIVVARDNEDVANAIARKYHDAGVLTIGLVYGAVPSCYDSIVKDAKYAEFPDIIKVLMQPLLTTGYINYDFYDVSMEFHDSGKFVTGIAEGPDMESAVRNLQQILDAIDVNGVGCLSIHLYTHRDKEPALTVSDVRYLNDLIARLPSSVQVKWSGNIDNTMPTDIIRLTAIMTGKEL